MINTPDAVDTMLAEPYKSNPDYDRFSDFLGLARNVRQEKDVAEKASYIYDWAKARVGRDNRNDILNEITRLQKELGTNARGRTLLVSLYRSARLRQAKIDSIRGGDSHAR